jgi:hypothetical protein
MATKWSLKGSYLAACSCKLLCPCPVDGDPSGPNGECIGTSVFHIDEGKFGGVDLSGINFGWHYWAPGHFTGGGLRMGIVLDESASEEQAGALEKILSGKEGGVWSQFVPLTKEWLGTERAKVTYSNGDNPKGSVAGMSDLKIDIFRSHDGAPTTVKQSQQHWRPEYTVGKASGSSEAFGITFQPIYGEVANYSFVSDQ